MTSFSSPLATEIELLIRISANSYLLLIEAPVQQEMARQLDACESSKPLVYLETVGKACILLQNQGLNLKNLYYRKNILATIFKSLVSGQEKFKIEKEKYIQRRLLAWKRDFNNLEGCYAAKNMRIFGHLLRCLKSHAC